MTNLEKIFQTMSDDEKRQPGRVPCSTSKCSGGSCPYRGVCRTFGKPGDCRYALAEWAMGEAK